MDKFHNVLFILRPYKYGDLQKLLVLAGRWRHSFSITFHYFLAPFKVSLANMLAEIEAPSNDFFAKTTFIPLLRFVSKINVLFSCRRVPKHCVASDTADLTGAWNEM